MTRNLTNWLCAAIPKTADYADVANACASLFCTVEFVPANLRDTARDKELLARSFAALARHHRFGLEFGQLYWVHYGASFHRPTDKGHWLEVMASVLKLQREPDLVSAANLFRSTLGGSTYGMT